MTEHLSTPCTAFDGHRLLSSGPLIEVALAVKTASQQGAAGPLLVFDDVTGRVRDLDLRGTKAEIIARLSLPSPPPRRPPPALPGEPGGEVREEARGRGRPKLGVVAREVTLLPRHWAWLASQPGGASVALRKLVEEARRGGGARQQARAAQEAAYHFMSALAGDLPGFEEAARALFADDRAGLERQIAAWPPDLRDHAVRLAFGGPSSPAGE